MHVDMNDPEERDARSIEIGMDAQWHTDDGIRLLYNDTMPNCQYYNDTLTIV